MIGGMVQILLSFIFGFAVFVLLLRFWLQLARAPFNNAFVQSIYTFLAPILRPLERVIPKFRNANLACLTLAYGVALLWAVAVSLSFEVSDLLMALWFMLRSGYWLMLMMLIIYVLSSFVIFRSVEVPQVAARLINPLVAPIRRIVPPIGPFDMAFAVLVLCLTLAYFLLEYFLVGLIQGLR
jgi:YggT family protein